jgi:hypothetical protein
MGGTGVELCLVELRLSGVQDAMHRARAAFFITILASAAVGTVLWNIWFAWDRRTFEANYAAAPRLNQVKYEEQIKNYVDYSDLSIAPLGIRVSGNDISVVGSLGLVLVSLYSFFCARRCNHEVGPLLREAQHLERATKRYVFFGIRQNMVLNPSTRDDAPYTSLDFPPAADGRGWIVRAIYRILTCLPAALNFGLVGHELYYCTIGNGWRHLSAQFHVQMVIAISVAGVTSGANGYLNWMTVRYGHYNRILIEQFRARYEALYGDSIDANYGDGPAAASATAMTTAS